MNTNNAIVDRLADTEISDWATIKQKIQRNKMQVHIEK